MAYQTREERQHELDMIEAKADARVRVLEARAKLGGGAQLVYALGDVIGSLFENTLVFIFIILFFAFFFLLFTGGPSGVVNGFWSLMNLLMKPFVGLVLLS